MGELRGMSHLVEATGAGDPTIPNTIERTTMHPSTEAILRYFDYDHLPPALQAESRPFHDLAHDLAERFEGAELTTALRKLLEAKDCAVRCALPRRV